jgi:hypothetical protein
LPRFSNSGIMAGGFQTRRTSGRVENSFYLRHH